MEHKVGTKVICNGYPGTITKVCDGQLKGMVEVRVPGGLTCVSATDVEIDRGAVRWDEAIDCEYCGGQARYIGTLALTDHFRCRQCGADHSIDYVMGTRESQSSTKEEPK